MKEDTIFDDIKSGVMSYARAFPVIFDRAQGTSLYEMEGNAYLDFLAGKLDKASRHRNPGQSR